MKAIFKLTMILWVICLLPASLQAQNTKPKSKKSSSAAIKQNSSLKFLSNRDAKRFVVGFQAGTSFFHGDADKLKPGYALGANVRYNFSHVLGVRALFNYGQVRSEVGKPAQYNYKYYNFKSNILEYQIQGILTLGNISFFRKKWNWNMYTMAGIGQVIMSSKSNYILSSSPTSQESHLQYDRTHIAFTYGIGFKHNITKSIDLGFEYGMRWTRTDSMDILNAPIHPNRRFDSYSLPQIILNIKIGKKGNEHLDWINPISSVYEELAKFEEKLDKLDKDSDGDGVADRFDKEENTPAGAKVWGDGTAADLDNDGVPDVNDQEPNTPPGAKVDPNTGIAEDEDGDGVPDILDLSPATPGEYLVNHQGIPIMNKSVADQIVNNQGGNITTIGGGGGVSFLPAIFFNTNIDEPYPSHLPDLQNVALAMKNNPNIKLEVIGNADQRNTDEYNLRLAQRRADNVKKILVQFGVDPSRLITKTNGERVPITKGTSASHLAANRRVQFFVVK
jgi:outer membrane protein OmpA-like peptidoglycan-associated protein/opacity protein-like surface antigen